MINTPPGKSWRDGEGLHVDTRGLSPPDPMVAILWHLEQPGEQGPVIAYLERNPIYLLPELAERGWKWDITDNTPGAVRLILRAEK
ncbi:MAG: DUF2249 domain-containing protein [Rhodobacteraceae bacterium]|nr:DUF2249 domain-containing protein [Paracoccaceae bacterium]